VGITQTINGEGDTVTVTEVRHKHSLEEHMRRRDIKTNETPSTAQSSGVSTKLVNSSHHHESGHSVTGTTAIKNHYEPRETSFNGKTDEGMDEPNHRHRDPENKTHNGDQIKSLHHHSPSGPGPKERSHSRAGISNLDHPRGPQLHNVETQLVSVTKPLEHSRSSNGKPVSVARDPQEHHHESQTSLKSESPKGRHQPHTTPKERPHLIQSLKVIQHLNTSYMTLIMGRRYKFIQNWRLVGKTHLV
jgi:hypothetical protein